VAAEPEELPEVVAGPEELPEVAAGPEEVAVGPEEVF
jgi:hypothetical protein